MEKPSGVARLSITTLLEGAKPIVLEKSQFGLSETSKFSSFSGRLGLSGFRGKDRDPSFFYWKAVLN